jgi:transposase
MAVLKNPAYRFKRIGLEAGPCRSSFNALAEASLPVVCVETRHMQAVLKAQINKTDRNDARGIVQMMRVGLYRPVTCAPVPSRAPHNRHLVTAIQPPHPFDVTPMGRPTRA